MIEEQCQAAADALWSLWQSGERIAALPEDARPRTREEGYAIQALVEKRSQTIRSKSQDL